MPSVFFLVGGKILHHPNFETKIIDFEVTNPLKSVRVVLGPKLSLGDENISKKVSTKHDMFGQFG